MTDRLHWNATKTHVTVPFLEHQFKFTFPDRRKVVGFTIPFCISLMAEQEIPNLVRTMLAAGFEIERVDRKPNFLAMHLRRADEFGVSSTYLLAYAGDNGISTADAEALRKVADQERSSLIIVSANSSSINIDLLRRGALLTKTELFGKVGGIVSSVLPLEPEYGEHLVTLGSNSLPPGLVGKPDDLFEAYTHAGLQFLLRGRVIRYGQERRFEAVPDGLVMSSKAPLMLYDCKAADEYYEFSKTTIRQFADYVKQFHQRYEDYVGRLHAFIAVSHAFQDEDTLMERSNELYSECGIQLVCLTAGTLADMVALFADRPTFRTIIDWKTVFVQPSVQIEKVRRAVQARIKDGVVKV